MSELLSAEYQNSIYWAALNAEQARERAANAELDYWVCKKERLMAGLECADGKDSPSHDGVRSEL